MAKKKILVKDILDLIDGEEEVNVQLYAYGIFHAQTAADGIKRVNDIKEHLIYDGLNAQVSNITINEEGCLSIKAEMVHK